MGRGALLAWLFFLPIFAHAQTLGQQRQNLSTSSRKDAFSFLDGSGTRQPPLVDAPLESLSAADMSQTLPDAATSEIMVNDEGDCPPLGRFGFGPFKRFGSLGQRLRRWFPRPPLPEFVHSDPEDPQRHIGLGYPLSRTSWLNRPYHVDWFVGEIFGDELINNRVDQGNDLIGGVRLGWDFDHYWGTELRAAFSEPDIFNMAPPARTRGSANEFFDLHLVYYPWGDARLRPYAALGVGIARFNFTDHNSQRLNASLFHLPLSLGIKYYFTNWLALRLDLTDNIAFGTTRVDGMGNFSFTAGTEIRFGGSRRSYYPFQP